MTGQPHLSRLGLGCSRVGSFNNPQSLRQSAALIRAALDLGVTVLDTSNIYGQGDSERTIGRAVKGRRDAAFIVSKVGRGFSGKMRMLAWAKPLVRPLLARRGQGGGAAVTARRQESLRYDWRPETFAGALDASLRRIGTDRLDGYLLHSPPAAVAGDAAVGAALARLRQAGKVRHYGVSCDDLPTLAAALTMEGLTMLQLPWDVIAAAGDLAAEIRRRGIIVLAREIIKLQPALAPAEAVARSVADPIVGCTLVGTTRIANLRALVDRVEGGR